MKKTLQKLRSQQPHVRMTVAFITAGILTAIIAAIWIGSLATIDDRDNPKVNAPSPLSGFISSVKGVVGRSQFGSGNSSVKVINAGDPDTTVPAADETTSVASPEDSQPSQ